MSRDNWWRGPRSSGCLESRSEDTAWPKLSSCSRRPPRSRVSEGEGDIDVVVERTRDQARSVDRSIVLDGEGYPLLGQRMSKRKLSGSRNPSTPGCSEETGVINTQGLEAQGATEEDQSARKFYKKARRCDLICFDLKKVLERQRSVSESQTASSGKPRLKLNLNLSIRNPLDSAQIVQCRRGKQLAVPRAKRISKLKRVIFRERESKRQANIRKREIFDLEKMRAITKDVNEIDFNRLKISADSAKPEVNFTRDMSTLTLFDKQYRKPPSDDVPEDTSETNYKNDVVGKLEALLIRRQSESGPEVAPEDEIEGDEPPQYLSIVTKTLCLKICDETGETVEEFEEPESTLQAKSVALPPRPEATKHSRHFREYCTNDLTPGLNTAMETFLANVYRLQKRLYERDEVKGRCRRRFYAGFKEVMKHVESKKIRFVVVAPDLEGIRGLDEYVGELIAACKAREVVFCFALNKRKLGYYTHKKGSVSCVGVTNYCGLEEDFEQTLKELMLARISYERSRFPEGSRAESLEAEKRECEDMLLSTRINLLFKALSITS